jgi:hypothetical protein
LLPPELNQGLLFSFNGHQSIGEYIGHLDELLEERRDRDSNPGDDLSDQHPFHENERNPFIFRHTENLRNFSGSNAV